MIKKLSILCLILTAGLFVSGCTDTVESTENVTNNVAIVDNITADNFTTETSNIVAEVAETNMTVETLTDEQLDSLLNTSIEL